MPYTVVRRMRRLSLAALTVLAACSKEPRIEERGVVVYSSRFCPVSQEAAYSVMYAAGDFEPAEDRPATSALFLRDVGTALAEFPSETRSIIVDVSQPGRDVDWRGYRERIPESGLVNVLVWPGGESCRLSRSVDRRTEGTLSVFGSHFLVAGGTLLDDAQVPHTYVGDLTTGIVERLELGLSTRRSRPSVTAFTMPGEQVEGALVAGGRDPDSRAALDTAEVYTTAPGGARGDFDRTRVELSEPRGDHGAVVLATGETLLVGGVGPGGALRTMEIVDPRTRRSRTNGVALLAVSRVRPTVLRLASGEIFVAGGLDAFGRPVPTLEWFSPDASRPTKRPVDLVTGRERAFVPLAAGGALAVIVPEDGAGPDFKTVWVISADGSLEPGVPIDPASLGTARLFEGAEGAPLLFTGQRWMRWQPWFGAFQIVADAPDEGPALDAVANGDPGLALWLEDRAEAGMYVTGFRFATRTRYGAVPKPLLVDGPGQLAPDRLAGIAGSSIRFDREEGLLMGPGASAFLTDVTFADFTLDVDVTAAAPTIVLRDDTGTELEVGGAGCAFAQGARRHIEVVRKARSVRVRADEGEERLCPTELAADARVEIGVRGGETTGLSGARNLVVVRR